MNNKVVNKQIPLETIVKVANHLEDYKEKYDIKFELEQNKNKNIPYGANAKIKSIWLEK